MLEAPMLFTGPPGRKCCYIIEDVVWLNIFPTLETDIETLEVMFLDMSDPTDQVETPFDAKERDANRVDYKAMLREYALTEQIMRERSEITVDQIPFPNGTYSVGVFESPIEGHGLFATADINIGDIIAPARIGMCRTPAGRFTNHAKNPNAVMVETSLGLDLKATRNIPGSRGGQRGAEITIDYRTNLIEREV